jgi:hypothetical protein
MQLKARWGKGTVVTCAEKTIVKEGGVNNTARITTKMG